MILSIKLTKTSVSCEVSPDGFVKKTYTLEYLVESDNQYEDPINVLNSGDLPQPYSYFSFGTANDLTARCTSATAERISQKGAGGAIYKCSFLLVSDKEETEEEEPNPDDEFTFDISFSSKKIPFERDLTGNKVVNVFGENYTPAPEREIKVPAFKISRTEKKNPIAKLGGFFEVLNLNRFWGFPAETLKLSVSPSWDGTRWRVSYEIENNPNGWNLEFLERSFRQKVYESESSEKTPLQNDEFANYYCSNNKYGEEETEEEQEAEHPFILWLPGERSLKENETTLILGEDGDPLETPSILNKYGEIAAKTDKPVYTRFVIYPSVDFEIFKLPNLLETL